MTLFGTLAFLTPWLLLALFALPILWWLLRAVPPAPTVQRFPGVRILLGLDDPEKTPDKTPWWLLLLRLLAIAAAILAFARPVLNPEQTQSGDGPLLVVMDGGWASAGDWKTRQDWLADTLSQAERNGRPTAFVSLSHGWAEDSDLVFQNASAARERIAVLDPAPLGPDRAGFADWLAGQNAEFDTIWLTDGLRTDGDAAFVDAITGQGDLTLVEGDTNPTALQPARLEDSELRITAIRSGGGEGPVDVNVIGPDPSGIERVLGFASGQFAEDETSHDLLIDMPFELRNRITRIELVNARSAAATVLADDGLRRRKVGLLAGGSDDEGQQLVQPLHYLRKALFPTAELVEASLTEMLTTAPDMIVMADVGTIAPAEQAALTEWVEAGGMLIRFAGPRLAKSGAGQLDEDPLLPVRLRAGGRSLGGTMSWGSPKRLRVFPEESPFFALPLPGDVDVSSQVMAQPDPDLPGKVMAALEDGTPLVTGTTLGAGRVILFHVTANAEWSSLPLSGLFVQMLERLTLLSGNSVGTADDLAGTQWTPERVVNGYGRLVDPPPIAGVDGALLASVERNLESPPGIYVSGERRVAVNLMHADSTLERLTPPAGATFATMTRADERDLAPPLLALAVVLLALDILASLFVSGRLSTRAAAMIVGAVLAGSLTGTELRAQDEAAIFGTNNTVLAYIETGDSRMDAVSEAGLRGLTRVLFNRTAIEPAEPVAVDLETDEIAFYPFLYWPVSERQSLPSDAAYLKLNNFLRSGGMILFDTKDAQLGGGGLGTPNGRVLQRLAAKLDIPPLEPVPGDHVLTRTFYLLTAFPGRWNSTEIWVEAAPNAEEVEGLPFRNLNDGVTPVVIGGNDWASAWAIDANGDYMFPVGSGAGGQRQREIAYRFGVNLVMHVMTGNYKSDQVHVPALLERLGQ